ncbi:MAG: DNA repair protein RecO [Clostridia bacterium]|nr:DNA repair protein RecO [Clostridia bacterium]
MILRTDGIVIREQNVGEQDRLITILTKEKGIIKGFVNGGRNPKNKNVAATGLLCYSDFSIEKTKRDAFVIKEATSKNVFFSLRENIISLSLAQYFAELTYELAPREEDSSEFLSLLLNAVFLISKGTKDLRLIKAVTELRMLSISGYMPSLVACATCSRYESERMYFDLNSGELFCEECNLNNSLQKLSLTTVSAMRHICFSEPQKIFSFTIPEGDLSDLSFVAEIYLRNITGRKYKTLDFYKMMTN